MSYYCAPNRPGGDGGRKRERSLRQRYCEVSSHDSSSRGFAESGIQRVQHHHIFRASSLKIRRRRRHQSVDLKVSPLPSLLVIALISR